MVAGRSEDEGPTDARSEPVVVRRGRRWRRIAGVIGLSLLLLILVAVAAIWIARRPIASNILEREFEQRGVEATYDLERVGLRTQVVRNLVIGDPEDPDLVARYALIQLRPRWTGSVEVYRIVARGVRLEGKVVDGRVVWGDVSKLLPPPSDQPFAFPDIVLDIADATISLQTPFGPLGLAVQGSGNLTGGFEGRLALASPQMDPGRCQITDINALAAIEIVARRPHVVGPLSADSVTCPASRFEITQPSFNIDSRFNESFTSFDGRGQVMAQRLVAGANGLAALIGNISFEGSPTDTRGRIDVAARESRLGPIFAERTRVTGGYQLSTSKGTFTMVGDYEAQDSSLADSMLAGIIRPLDAAAQTPIGPIASAMARAFRTTASSFDASGEIRVVNFPGGGAARIETAEISADNGARASVSGGDGVTYYWPSGRLRIDGLIEMRGGGLPTGQVLLREPRGGGPMSGVARFEPYSVGESVLAMEPIRFRATPSGATEFSTVVQVSGPFPDGRVRDLRLPLEGRFGSEGGFRVGPSCIVARFDFLRFRELELGPTRVPICPAGQPAIVMQRPGGGVSFGARIASPNFRGRLGSAPLQLTAGSALLAAGKDFTLTDATMRLGNPDAPVIVQTDRLRGTFAGSGISGTLSDAEVVIGNVPLRISEANAEWRFYQGDLIIEDDLLVSDRAENPRFYPLHSNDFRFVLSGSEITAGGSLRHPGTGIKVTDVSIEHNLDTGAGHALLDVPGLTFGEQLQPEEITRLTEGVVALVQGTVRGQGRINWSGEGEVTSTGEFSTVGMDLAAPFGPVTGLTTTVRFTDLLGLETAPGQVATIASINPGILVENGVITYQLLPEQRVRIQRGEWPFMGGRLILHETILNFARPTPKRLTFEVVGFDAKTFIDSLGFTGIEITGTFDGVLPMIFDDEGGRIVGGRLEARPPGGEFRYTGTKPDAGLVAGVAFDLLSNMRYENMVVRLDGDLAGEFATRFTISNISLGEGGGFVAGLVRNAFDDVPLIVNLNIKGPFRALINMAKGFKDPTDVIQPVMPFPLDAPGVVTETRTLKKEEDQTRTTPAETIEPTAETPTESER